METESHQFAELFPSVYEHFCRRWGLDEHRPSPEASAILTHLTDTGPLTVTEAARHFDRSQAATSELLNRLKARGLVESIPDERDQRRHLVWLTPAGRHQVAEMRRVLDADRLEAAFARLSAAERGALVRGMRALLRAARTQKHETEGSET